MRYKDQQPFHVLNNTVIALSAFVSFLSVCHRVRLVEAGYKHHMVSMAQQINLWFKTCGKEKKEYNTFLKVSN